MSNTAKTKLTDDEKRDFYRDGFVVLRNLISAELIETALSRYRANQNGLEMMHATEFTDLINKSRFSDLIKNTIGDFDPPQSTQVGVTPANSTQVRSQRLPIRSVCNLDVACFGSS